MLAAAKYCHIGKDQTKRTGEGISRYFLKHPYQFWVTAFIGVPILLLSFVAIFTFAVMLPISILMGWM